MPFLPTPHSHSSSLPPLSIFYCFFLSFLFFLLFLFYYFFLSFLFLFSLHKLLRSLSIVNNSVLLILLFHTPQVLNLCRNKLRHINATAFQGLRDSLENLDLQGNEIVDFHECSLDGFHRIETINLKGTTRVKKKFLPHFFIRTITNCFFVHSYRSNKDEPRL